MVQQKSRAAPTRRCGHYHSDTPRVKASDEIMHTGHGRDWCCLPEQFIFAIAIGLKLFVGQRSQEMKENFPSLVSVQHEIKFAVGHVLTECSQKFSPCNTMCGMAINNHAIHVKDDSLKVPGILQ